VSFLFVDRRSGRGVNFFYFTTLALVLMLMGTLLLWGGSALAFFWLLLALVAATLGGRFDRVTLRVHCAAYALLAAYQVGLITRAWAAFSAPADPAWMTIHAAAPAILAGLMATYVLLVVTQRSRRADEAARLPRFVLAAAALLGLSAFVVILLHRSTAHWWGTSNPAVLATIRTGVLSVSAVLLAVAGRSRTIGELSWLVYPVLALGAVKLVAEDLRGGEAAALTVAFIFFGMALIFAPRLLRGAESDHP
jgi:hypothetical protein